MTGTIRTGTEIVTLALVAEEGNAIFRQRIAVREQCLAVIAQLQARFVYAQTLPQLLAIPEYHAIQDELRATLVRYAVALGWPESQARQWFVPQQAASQQAASVRTGGVEWTQ